ncbi:hypothetical protein [Streptomyces sp. NPDC088923]|uniref:hypothetical protein n=1 Tax=Streptomyces sp. NPDC088923 TaxID=3365913 RepID=UPI003827B71B
MNIKITGPAERPAREDWQADSFADLRPLAAALAALAEMYPGLPPVRFTADPSKDNPRLTLAASAPHDFELWRNAFQVPADRVDLVVTEVGEPWLRLLTVFAGVEVLLLGYGLTLTTVATMAAGEQVAA